MGVIVNKIKLFDVLCWKNRVVPSEPKISMSEAGKAKEVIKRELDPVKGMMQGKLKLKGDLPTIVRYVKAANELVNLAGSVPTEFVDERA